MEKRFISNGKNWIIVGEDSEGKVQHPSYNSIPNTCIEYGRVFDLTEEQLGQVVESTVCFVREVPAFIDYEDEWACYRSPKSSFRSLMSLLQCAIIKEGVTEEKGGIIYLKKPILFEIM